MRILHFYKTYKTDSFGGTEQFIWQLCKKGANHNVTSRVLSLSTKSSVVEFDGHEVYRAKLTMQIASMGVSISVFRKFSELAKLSDVIHYHFPWPFMDIVHFATRIRKPTVVTYHSDIVRQTRLLRFYRPLQFRFLSSVDRIVATSPNYFATSPVLDRYRDKTSIIPIGLDKSSYPVPSIDLLAKWRSRVGDRFFLFIGMIRYYKGLHILLNAVKGTNYPVVIVGSGPLEAELKNQVQELGLKGVYFLGTLSDVDKVALLQLCFAVAFPSHLRSEAFGISLLEGAMFGKPMISSEIGTGTSYINIDGKTGIVVPSSDPAAFRKAMRYLWENPEVAVEMGESAEKRYWELFTADQMASRYAELYKELIVER